MDYCNIDPKNMGVQEALKLNAEQKQFYFEKALVSHPMVKRTLTKMQALVSPYSGTQIVFLIGPTGVGKTLLVQQLKEAIIKNKLSEIKTDPSYIPVISVEAPSSGEPRFSWRILYTRLGMALNEPLMEKKIEDRSENGKNKVVNVTSRSTIAGLRQSVENAMGYRRTSIIIIDEAIHVFRRSKDDTLETKMETLKSLANIHGTTMVLVGSYDLYGQMLLNEQVTRRTSLVHFKRYMSENENDVNRFTKSLNTLRSYLPLKGVPNLEPLAEDLMLPCIGCVGILKDTLQKTLALSLSRFKGKWNDKCLEEALLSGDHIDSILQKVSKGEEQIKNAEFGSNQLTSNK